MLKKILKVLGGLIAVFVVVGVFLPSAYSVSRSENISAPPELIFDHINNLKLSQSWSPWAEGDDTMKVVYSGPEAGVGAKSTWTSEHSGNGNQTITKSEAYQYIEIALDFGDQGQGTAEYALARPTESGDTRDAVEVTWSMHGDNGFNLIGRYFGLFMDKMLGGYFDKGLANLKRVTESKAKEESATRAAAEQAVADQAARTQVMLVGDMLTPESVLYDAIDDVYLVSNINGSPFGLDDNGYIARVGTDGSVLEVKWIDGASDAVKLNAPKGMAIVGDTLYVADINVVRVFDRATGAPKGEVKVAGATFLNDVTAGTDGTVYVSDSGFKEGFKPSGTDAIYKLVDGKAVVVIKDKTLGGPNGLLATAAGVWVVTFGSGELYLIDASGAKSHATPMATGSLDGIIQLGDGSFVISSWAGSSLLRGNAGGEFTVLVTDQKSPADIGYDSKRNRVLIPHFEGNTIEIRQL